MYTVYGIPNCDTVKKATTWLKDHNINFEFHDYKKQGIATEKLQSWCKQKGWEIILNKKSSTFKGLHQAVQQNAVTENAAIEIMEAQNSTIKRPVIEFNNKIVAVGFDEKKYEIIFG